MAKTVAVLAGLLLMTALPVPTRAAEDDLDPRNATWHIGLVDLFGRNKDESRRLDVYATFENGELVRALATARRFNTSIHLLRSHTIRLDGESLSGTMTILVTPDAWVPADGRPFEVIATIDGRLGKADGQWQLSGAYEASLPGGAVIGGDEVPAGTVIKGNLIGGIGATETGWENATWRVEMSPMVEKGSPPLPKVKLTLGVADGKVQWCAAGRTFDGECPRTAMVDVSGLNLDGATIRGTFRAPAGAMNVTLDPKAVADAAVMIHRVQGLVGGSIEYGFSLDGQPVGRRREGFGCGGASQGGGKPGGPEPLWEHALSDAPWFVPVEGFVPPEPGEHPRLLFRKSDLKALRQKADTPEGKAIVQRLRYLLDGKNGETMTGIFSTATHAYMGGGYSSTSVDTPGCYTYSHAAGYGLLYQLTGDKKYADFGRQCFEKAWEGVRDRDDRYSWKDSGGALRAGPALGWYAVGYDLCYDGWDEDFRQKVAREIQNYDGGSHCRFVELVRGLRVHPGSNHWGMQVGGGAMALLAILNDPGVDAKALDPLVTDSVRSMIRLMRYGWGDRGSFAEGDGTGHMSAHHAFLPALQAWRVAGGKDFISPRSNAEWMALRWIHLSVIDGGKIWFPKRGGYPKNVWSRRGAGYFSQGFACVTPEKVPAVLWYYDRFLKDADAAGGAPYNTGGPYPHDAVLAMVNWPVGLDPKNPAEVIDKAQADTVFGHCFTRNQWKDGNDIVVSLLVGDGMAGYIDVKEKGLVMIRGLGQELTWRTGMGRAVPVYYRKEKDGSFVASAVKGGDLSSFAVDFSGASGAEALLVGVGPGFTGGKKKTPPRLPKPVGGASAAYAEIEAGGHTFCVLTLQTGEAPKPAADGQAVKVGKQTIRFDGQTLVLEAE